MDGLGWERGERKTSDNSLLPSCRTDRWREWKVYVVPRLPKDGQRSLWSSSFECKRQKRNVEMSEKAPPTRKGMMMSKSGGLELKQD